MPDDNSRISYTCLCFNSEIQGRLERKDREKDGERIERNSPD